MGPLSEHELRICRLPEFPDAAHFSINASSEETGRTGEDHLMSRMSHLSYHAPQDMTALHKLEQANAGSN
jgi:hypothetical protein